MIKVLFVCLGNICRSPTAHGVFEHLVAQAGLSDSIRVESAGTGAYHVGEPSDPRSVQEASKRGYDLSAIRAQQVKANDFQRFDYILAMDHSNLADLKALCPVEHQSKVALFLDYGQVYSEQEVPDPYYGGGKGFLKVLDLVEDASQGLLAVLIKSGGETDQV
ncbi:MAG: phosphotyrosine protein phosphatase [Gammaproteobacteria bacterium]|nr:MAG: phosphotyrosine protein phosphatase [Gammaproteobacteria bacterium]